MGLGEYKDGEAALTGVEDVLQIGCDYFGEVLSSLLGYFETI